MSVKALIVSAGLILIVLVLCLTRAESTPMYAARAGRTCDNCHVTPNNWIDPKLSERKCTLSCQGCHVDPAGGGMRNVVGRYYGRATLPMIAYSPRPTADWDRNLWFVGRRDVATTYTHNLPMGPADFADSHAYVDSVDDRWAWGKPRGDVSKHGFWPGRYDRLNADPVFRIGTDIRLAVLASGGLMFPMQVDVSAALHPVHHTTAFVNVGARGQPSGYSDTFDSDHSPYLREAFLLLHEAPSQAYLKAGRFVPSFGLRLDDHTSSIRREFELDGALPESRVTGVEIGAAPNYPFFNLSWFRSASRARVPDAWDIFDVDDGWGGALNAGWRHMGWTAGGSALVRRRPLDEGGDTSTFGAYGALNPWYYSQGIPLTYQAEFDYGRFTRGSGNQSDKAAFYQQLDWIAWNGLNFLMAHDWVDPDREVLDDESHRVQAGVQIVVVPGVTFDGRLRYLVPAAGGSGADLFFQLHLWQ